MAEPRNRYSTVSLILHWVIAVAVVTQVALISGSPSEDKRDWFLTNEMKREAHGTQQPRHINAIGEGASTAQRSDLLVQSINQRFPNM